MKIKFTITALLVGMFLINLASANGFITTKANCAGQNHIIMGISDITNSHAELFNQNNYNYVLCCVGGSDNSCDSTNKILGLYTQTNSHAEIPQLNNYGNKVCYEDFSCVSRNNSCNLGEVGLLSLIDSANSHIGSFNDYSIKICCKSNFLDADEDGIINLHDPDYNGDGIMDFPFDLVSPTGDIDGDGILNINDSYMDGDGILNGHDPDFNGDGVMELFISIAPNGDIDGDGILNINDGDIDGDGILNGYDSDVDGNGVTDIYCGNSIKETGEQCDDGNHRNGDGCSRVCRDEGDDDDERHSSSSYHNDKDCSASWSCSGWSDCVDGYKTRICTDSRACGIISNKPSEIESCEEGIVGSLISGGTISLHSSSSKVWGISLNTLFWILIIATLIILILVIIKLLMR